MRYEISTFKEVEKHSRKELLSFPKGTDEGFIKEVVFEVAHWLILWKFLFIPADISDFGSEEVLLNFPLLTLKFLQRNCNKQIYFLQKESTQTPWHSHSTYFTHGIFYVWESRLGNGSNTQGPQNIYVGKYT